MNALAGRVGNLAAEGLRAPFAADEPPDPAWLAEVDRRLEAPAAADATLAAELARLLTPIATFLPLLRGVTDTALRREDAVAATLCIWPGRHLDRLGPCANAWPYLERVVSVHCSMP
ncbi:MAG: hypothetical protein SNJ69_15565 [Chloroflexaceae bacterium]